MKGSELITRCKIKIPNLKETALSDSDILTLINEAAVEINLLAKTYRGSTTFARVANQQEYALSTYAPNFQQVVTAGLWMLDSTTSKYKRIIPRTEEWLNKRVPNWRDADPGTGLPQYYFITGNTLTIYPAVSSDLTNGMRLYHTILPTDMSNGDQYPFSGSGTELKVFRPFDNAIVEYVRWIIAPNLNQQAGEDPLYNRFLQFVNRAKNQIRSIPDAINYYDTAIQVSV